MLTSDQKQDAERVKFVDLFDMAPVGYFILNDSGIIEDVNVTGAILLKRQKAEIIQVGFMDFIGPSSREIFQTCLLQMRQDYRKQTCELNLVIHGNEVFVRLEGIAIHPSDLYGLRFYITLIDITENRRSEQEAEDLRLNQQRIILNATLTAQETERAALSQVLHDSICQLLYGIKLNLQNMQFSNHYKGPFQRVNHLLDQVIRETRDISYELTPSVLRDFGFVAGIKEMVQRLSTKNFVIDLSIETETDLLHPQIQLYLFRIIQELINNCIKHANASQVQVFVTLENDWITLLVSDNGNGFKKSIDQSLKGGSGMRGIKNRVFLLNGEIAFRSSKDGTSISIVFKNDLVSMDTGLI